MSDKPTVLIVEDDLNLLSGMQEILELENYSVLTASNGVAGLSVLQGQIETPPDIIVSDVMMPHMNGFQFLEEVRKVDQWVTIPFIFLTARGEKQDRYKGANLGADLYLMKPFDADELLVAISTSLKRQRERDRVRHQEYENQLQNQVTDVKRQILTILNHEMRTPLTLVVAYADMLKDFDTSNMSEGDVMTFLRGVNSGADRLRRLIENFITLVEIDSGDAAKTFGWRKRDINSLRDIIRDAHKQIEQPETRPRNFVLNVPERIPTITVDVQFLTMVIRELLDNAAKFSDDHGRVVLDVSHDEDFVHITIQDWGRGIPEHEIERIWERFYQINRELYEDQGAGSGLAIVVGLMHIHNGTWHVESVDGEGSIFSIALPIKA